MRHEFEFTADIPFIKAALRRDLLWKGYVLAGIFLLTALAMRFVIGSWEPFPSGFLVVCTLLIVPSSRAP